MTSAPLALAVDLEARTSDTKSKMVVNKNKKQSMQNFKHTEKYFLEMEKIW